MGWKSYLGTGLGIAATFIPVVGPLVGPAIAAAGIAADQNDAAKKAAEQQTSAGDKSIALQREMYEQSRADLAPYRNTGGAAMGTLGSLMGLPTGGSGADAAADPSAPPVGANPNRRPFSGDPVGHAQPRTEPLPGKQARLADARRVQAGASQQASSSFAPRADGARGQGGGLVRMQAPDGRVVLVPSAKVQEATSQGGVVLQ